MDVTMKSGTNEIHGAAYEFLQNDKLNANSWDSNKAGYQRGPLEAESVRRRGRRRHYQEPALLVRQPMRAFGSGPSAMRFPEL